MANGIKTYSTTAASNTALFPEGMAPSAVNDGMRQVEADIRSWYQDAEWADWNDTPSRASASTFKIATDVTSRYLAGRRVRMNDATTLYGTIASSAYSAPDTTVTMTMDSGSLTTSLTAVAIGILSPTNISIPTFTPTFTNITVPGTTTLSGSVRMNTTLTVDGASTFSGAVTISGAAVFSTTLKLDTANLNRKGTDIASATTTDLSTATGDFVDVTGTTTITGLGTLTAGVERVVRFTGALTLTHSGTALILPGAANITTASGDTATFRSLGSGNWICIQYKKADGTAVVASASSAPFSDSTGIVKNNSDNTKIFKIDASGITTGTTRTWTMPDTNIANAVVQRVGNQTGTFATGSTAIPFDNTIPQITEGNQYLSQAITPKNTANKLVIQVTLIYSIGAQGTGTVALFQDSTANALACAGSFWIAGETNTLHTITFTHVMTAGTTSATTFTVRMGGASAATNGINGDPTGSGNMNGTFASSIIITEYAS